MKYAFHSLTVILTALLLAGCGNGSEFRRRLMALDSALINHPDSVYRLLKGMEGEAQRQSHSDLMYYELLRADAQNKAYIDFTSDSTMLEVVSFYDHHGTPNEQLRAHYLLGCTKMEQIIISGIVYDYTTDYYYGLTNTRRSIIINGRIPVDTPMSYRSF